MHLPFGFSWTRAVFYSSLNYLCLASEDTKKIPDNDLSVNEKEKSWHERSQRCKGFSPYIIFILPSNPWLSLRTKLA
jgi:hypothetical protein